MQINISHKTTIQKVPQLKIFSNLFLFIIFVCTGSSLLFTDFSLVAVSGGYSLIAVQELLIVVAFLLQSMGSRCMGFRSGSIWAQ